ncbi:DNA polymerase III subunit epsilon [Flavobacterium rivuli WB 3.3-2 = DSM 21788]|uniref:DNA polymerase III subunit epsilon n=1 Tax=Flavobacterium rivuli WB 3.3-2 = DSM 21788 TaxID=1121895 RepID=A0A0A2M2I5_9FLAO|nr:3'-5' exonuclease [Flavobacterium rivuli]KGO86857.1 DNA polymerase III subunit epsilon [Flavobacterium rivuli WB 3.3-2 = DSM 21788]
MAFEWLTGSTPQFWKNYINLFDTDDNSAQKRFVVFDMETTGVDAKEDVILSIGAIAVVGNGIEVGDFLEVAILQDKFSPKSIAFNNGIVDLSSEKVVEAEGMIQFLNFVKDSILVGHNVNLDIEMVNQALKRLDLGRLKNPLMDTNALYQRWKGLPDDTRTSLDDVCDALKIDKSDRLTAWGNAYTTALVFLKLKRKIGI